MVSLAASIPFSQDDVPRIIARRSTIGLTRLLLLPSQATWLGGFLLIYYWCCEIQQQRASLTVLPTRVRREVRCLLGTHNLTGAYATHRIMCGSIPACLLGVRSLLPTEKRNFEIRFGRILDAERERRGGGSLF